VIVVPAPSDTSMIGKLKAVRKAIPKALRENPNLRILMSIDDFDKYDDELTEREYKEMREKYEDTFEAGMGAEAVQKLLAEIDLEALSAELHEELEKATGQKRVRLLKRLEDDLRTRVMDVHELHETLRAEWHAARDADAPRRRTRAPRRSPRRR